MTINPDEAHLEPILEPILRALKLTHCPICHTPLKVANVGFNTESDNFKDVFPIVYLACKVCKKRLKCFNLNDFVLTREQAIDALAREVTGTHGP